MKTRTVSILGAVAVGGGVAFAACGGGPAVAPSGGAAHDAAGGQAGTSGGIAGSGSGGVAAGMSGTGGATSVGGIGGANGAGAAGKAGAGGSSGMTGGGAPPEWGTLSTGIADCDSTLQILKNPATVATPFVWKPCASGLPECMELGVAPKSFLSATGAYDSVRAYDDGTNKWLLFSS